MRLAYFLTSVAVSAVPVVGQTACSTPGVFTSYTDLVLKAFYSGNPTPVPIYVKNVLTVPHVGYDILSACTSTPCSTSKTYMTMISGKLRPWVPGNTFLQTVSLPVVDGASPPFIAQNPLPPGSASYCGVPNPTPGGQPLLAVNGYTDRWSICQNTTASGRTDLVYNAAVNPCPTCLSDCNGVTVEIYGYP